MSKHKRSEEAIYKRGIRRKLRRLVLSHSFNDLQLSETVCLVSRADLMTLAGPEVQVSDVPDVVRGDILIDSRGQGTFQKK